MKTTHFLSLHTHAQHSLVLSISLATSSSSPLRRLSVSSFISPARTRRSSSTLPQRPPASSLAAAKWSPSELPSSPCLLLPSRHDIIPATVDAVVSGIAAASHLSVFSIAGSVADCCSPASPLLYFKFY